jgi:hypothetical protein
MMHKHIDKIKQWVKMLEAGHPEDKIVKCEGMSGNWSYMKYPKWDLASQYRVALAFVEGKPVFEGDVLYDSRGNKFTASEHYTGTYCDSWNPPIPKTITVTIPVPKMPMSCEYGIAHITFDSQKDANIAIWEISNAMGDKS